MRQKQRNFLKGIDIEEINMNEKAKMLIPKIRANKLVRVAVYPIETIHRYLLQREYQNSEDSRYLKSLHDKFHGERCFIIGNGPSLRPEDLDKLVGEVSFAANRIYHIFSQTIWRPTFYVSTDNDVISAEIGQIKASGTYEKFLNYKAKKYGRVAADNLHYINVNGLFKINKNDVCPDKVSNDLSHHCSQFGTVTANSIELAIYMGFSEIYLLGVNHSYSVTMGKDGKTNRDESVKSNYFAGIENTQGHAGLPVMFTDASNNAYVLLKKYADGKGIKIFNATRGGKLEVFERVDFDKLMEQE